MTIALLFPGQGAQTVGMGAELAARNPNAVALFERAQEILGYNLLKLCIEGPSDQLNCTEFSQPALFVHSCAVLEELEQQQPGLWNDVSAVAGLSLGEYSALAATRAITFEDGVRLVQARGQAMQAAANQVASGMSSIIGLGQDLLQSVCQAASRPDCFVQIANLLCPGNIAISGHTEALEKAESLALEAGAMKAVRLQVAGAFHTSIMQPAVESLQVALAQTGFSSPRVPIYSNVDARPHAAPEELQRLLSQQVISPVLWEESLRNLLASGVENFYEIGAGKVLAGTIKRINRKMPCQSFGG